MLFGDQYEVNLEPRLKTADELKQSTHFESDRTIDTITNNISGYGWTVDFYNQILKDNDARNPLDMNLSTAIQRYRKIENLEIKLQSPLSSTSVRDIKGEAYVNIGSAVYQGDIFTAILKNNRVGIFVVDEIQDTTYETVQIALINFTILGYGDTEYNLYKNLMDKVDITYVYNNDITKSNNTPIIVKEDYLKHNKLLKDTSVLINNYLNKFLDRTYGYIRYTNKGRLLVDPYLNDFILAVFSSNDIPLLKEVIRIDSFDNRSNDYTLFNSLLGIIDIDHVSKLRFLHTDNDRYFKNYISADYISGINGREISIKSKKYFIEDDFYIKNEYIEDSFKKIFHNYSTGNILRLDEISDEIDKTLKMDDLDIYFRLPILIMIYRSYSFRLRS